MSEMTLDIKDVKRIVDTSVAEEEWLGNAGHLKDGVIHSVHVTDDPDTVFNTLRRGIPLSDGRDADRHGELGRGLYASSAPQLWTNRCCRKFDFLDGLSKDRRELLSVAIQKCLVGRGNNYLTDDEKEIVSRDLSLYVETGRAGAVTYLSGQPYNVSFWTPAFLKPLGIQPSPQPQMIDIVVKGKFAEAKTHLLEDTVKTLMASGVHGAFLKSGWSFLPQLVVWSNEALVRFGEWERY